MVIKMTNEFDRQQKKFWGTTTNLRSYDHIVVKTFAQQRVKFIEKLLDSWQPRNALDVGCGDGFGMFYMRSAIGTIHGCDVSAKMLKTNPTHTTFLTQCDAYALPWKDNSFDLVYCWEFLHHVADPERVVREMVRVAARCVLICEPNCLNPAMALFGLWVSEERGLLRFTPSYAGRLLKEQGLEGVSRTTVGYFTPNRTPQALAFLLACLPYRVPLIGMYTVAVGYKEGRVAERRAPNP
jgi:SAM-dependent methyltransferase